MEDMVRLNLSFENRTEFCLAIPSVEFYRIMLELHQDGVQFNLPLVSIKELTDYQTMWLIQKLQETGQILHVFKTKIVGATIL